MGLPPQLLFLFSHMGQVQTQLLCLLDRVSWLPLCLFRAWQGSDLMSLTNYYSASSIATFFTTAKSPSTGNKLRRI